MIGMRPRPVKRVAKQSLTPGERRLLIAADAFHRRRVNAAPESIAGSDPQRLGVILRQAVAQILLRRDRGAV
jgi:hypothetical protein